MADPEAKPVSKKRIRVPRLSVSVTMLSDHDVIALNQAGADGYMAFWAFIMLCLAAKVKEVGSPGRFTQPKSVIAASAHITPEAIDTAVRVIGEVCKKNGTEPWLYWEGTTLVIRSFEKWNPPSEGRWGGDRIGSGRPAGSQNCDHGNQDRGIKKSRRGNQDIKRRASVSVSVSVPEGQQSPSGTGPTTPLAIGAASSPAPAPDVLSDDERRRMIRASITRPIGEVPAADSPAKTQAAGFTLASDRAIEDVEVKAARVVQKFEELRKRNGTSCSHGPDCEATSPSRDSCQFAGVD